MAYPFDEFETRRQHRRERPAFRTSGLEQAPGALAFRLVGVLLAVLAASASQAPSAQGRYLSDGFGASGSISALPQPAPVADVAFVETGVVAVIGRLEVEGAYGWYADDRVEGYAAAARVGLLVVRQKHGGPATVALRTGLAFGEARAYGSRYSFFSTVQQTFLALEVARALGQEGGVQVTPFASGTFSLPIGANSVNKEPVRLSASTGVGVSIPAGAFRLVAEPRLQTSPQGAVLGGALRFLWQGGAPSRVQ